MIANLSFSCSDATIVHDLGCRAIASGVLPDVAGINRVRSVIGPVLAGSLFHNWIVGLPPYRVGPIIHESLSSLQNQSENYLASGVCGCSALRSGVSVGVLPCCS